MTQGVEARMDQMLPAALRCSVSEQRTAEMVETRMTFFAIAKDI